MAGRGWWGSSLVLPVGRLVRRRKLFTKRGDGTALLMGENSPLISHLFSALKGQDKQLRNWMTSRGDWRRGGGRTREEGVDEYDEQLNLGV